MFFVSYLILYIEYFSLFTLNLIEYEYAFLCLKIIRRILFFNYNYSTVSSNSDYYIFSKKKTNSQHFVAFCMPHKILVPLNPIPNKVITLQASVLAHLTPYVFILQIICGSLTDPHMAYTCMYTLNEPLCYCMPKF